MADYLETMGMTLNMDDVTEIGEADGYTFYLFQDLDDDISAFRPEFAEEFTTLRDMIPDIAAGATLYVPAKPYADVIGKTLTFTTTDVEGNPVTSEELFGQHEITMLNLWTSQCHFCIEELPKPVPLLHRRAARPGRDQRPPCGKGLCHRGPAA